MPDVESFQITLNAKRVARLISLLIAALHKLAYIKPRSYTDRA
jgi:hypothetical protein